MSKAKKAFRKVIDGVSVQCLDRLVLFLLPPGMNGEGFRDWRFFNKDEIEAWLINVIAK